MSRLSSHLRSPRSTHQEPPLLLPSGSRIHPSPSYYASLAPAPRRLQSTSLRPTLEIISSLSEGNGGRRSQSTKEVTQFARLGKVLYSTTRQKTNFRISARSKNSYRKGYMNKAFRMGEPNGRHTLSTLTFLVSPSLPTFSIRTLS